MKDYIIDQQDKFDDSDFRYEEFLKTQPHISKELETQELFRKAYGKDLSGMIRNRVPSADVNYLNNPNF